MPREEKQKRELGEKENEESKKIQLCCHLSRRRSQTDLSLSYLGFSHAHAEIVSPPA